MDPNNPIVKLCIKGLKAETTGLTNEAILCFEKAWKMRKDSLDACIAAHYLAKHQKSNKDELRWNLKALKFANKSPVETVKDFYPSLYLNIAAAYEKLDNRLQANKYYSLASQSITDTSKGSYGELLVNSIAKGLERTNI